jgi:hypothetical protein
MLTRDKQGFFATMLLILLCAILPLAIGYGIERQKQVDIYNAERLCAQGYESYCSELWEMNNE